MAKINGETSLAFTDKELKLIRKMNELYGHDRCLKDWRQLLDQWYWWSANWRKFPGFFLGVVATLSFDVFLARQDIAKCGFQIYEKLSKLRRRKVSRMNARAHD